MRTVIAIILVLISTSAMAADKPDTSSHRVHRVTVEKGVVLEVLDWGGTGRPLVFLAGFGNTAHTFDNFASRFTSKHRVYGITRRGFGLSSKPPPTLQNYDPNRLADDVVSVIAALNIMRPILVGHSIAGQELSSIGSRHAGKVAGLVYLDAANHQAFFNPKTDILYPHAAAMLRNLARLPSLNPTEARKVIAEMKADIPGLQRGMDWYLKALAGEPDLPPERLTSSQRLVQNVMVASARKYTRVEVPMLALFAVPLGPWIPSDKEQIAFVKAANPSAHVVALPGANHFLYQSDPERVTQAMNKFFGGLPN